MSVYIKGMEMPTGCVKCLLNSDSKCLIMPNAGYDETNGSERRHDCPLVPVPPHGRILKVLKTERECVSRNCDRNCGKCDLSLERSEILSAYDALIAVLDAPTIIPADKEGEG